VYHARGAYFNPYKDLYSQHTWEERVRSTKPRGCCMCTSSWSVSLKKTLCILSWLMFQPLKTTMVRTNQTIVYSTIKLKVSE